MICHTYANVSQDKNSNRLETGFSQHLESSFHVCPIQLAVSGISHFGGQSQLKTKLCDPPS
jgi:hypothetical protein